MDALILAAGLGSRLRPLTQECPKAMVKYNSQEIITHQINTLYDVGIDRIIIVTGYKSKILNNFLSKKYNKNFIIIDNKQYASTNSAYSFMQAVDSIESESYIHLNSDILFSKNLLLEIINSKYENVIAARDDLKFTDKMENIIVKGNRVINMSVVNTPEVSFKGFGLAKISNNALEENLKQYRQLTPALQRKENYYGLIRMSLGEEDYNIVKSDKFNLSEINTLKDFDQCCFKQ